MVDALLILMVPATLLVLIEIVDAVRAYLTRDSDDAEDDTEGDT